MTPEHSIGEIVRSLNYALGILGFFGGIFGLYAHMYIGQKLSAFEDKILDVVNKQYATKEGTSIRLEDLERRLDLMERKNPRFRKT